VFPTSRLVSAEDTDPPGDVPAAGPGTAPGAIVTGVVRDPPDPSGPSARRARQARRFAGHGWYRLISPLAVVGLWQLASSTGLLPASKLASPATIAHTAYSLVVSSSPTYGTLQGSLLASFERWAIGFALGVAIGVLLAIVSGLSRVGEVVADPILQALRSVPLLGLIPLFIVWFGIGQLPKVLFVLLSALFPMYLNTFAGIRGVDSRLGELGIVLGLRKREIIRHIVLPGALPSALTGLQLSVVASLLALVVGEQINATSGLGFMITQAQQFLNNSVIMVSLIVYAILGLLLDGAVRLLQRRALAWRRDFGA
jgi:sulfonate transport system permease protein